ncbi:MAG: hypothetical protein AB4080_21405 [Trichodesmium sp.]
MKSQSLNVSIQQSEVSNQLIASLQLELITRASRYCASILWLKI